MRWSVVPPSFRSLLPEAHKSRDSHDIVLLCTRCHEVCVAPYAAHRRALFAAHQARSRTGLPDRSPRPSPTSSLTRAPPDRAPVLTLKCVLKHLR